MYIMYRMYIYGTRILVFKYLYTVHYNANSKYYITPIHTHTHVRYCCQKQNAYAIYCARSHGLCVRGTCVT